MSTLFFTAFVFIAPAHAYVGNPARFFTLEGKGKIISAYSDAEAEVIYDRKAKFQSKRTEIEFYGARTGVVVDGIAVIYGGAGAARMKESFMVKGVEFGMESDYGFSWLAGYMFKVYEHKLKFLNNSRILMGWDMQFRHTDLQADSIKMGGEEYAIDDPALSYMSIEYNDWHSSLSCALDLGWISPYLGLKYSDFEAPIVARINSVLYDKDNAEADDNFGVFAGASIRIVDSLNATIEVSFIDEESIIAGGSFSF